MVDTLDFVRDTFTFSEFFGKDVDITCLEEDIRHNASISIMLPILSRFASVDPCDSRMTLGLREGLFTYIKNKYPEKLQQILDEQQKDGFCFAPHHALYLMKYILVLAEDQSCRIDEVVCSWQDILFWCFQLADAYGPDYMIDGFVNQKKLEHSAMREYMIQSNNDWIWAWKSSLFRTLIIYTYMFQSSDRFHAGDFININEIFESKNGYSIEEYIGFLYVIFQYFYIQYVGMPIVSGNWFVKISEIFIDQAITEKASNILNSLTFDRTNAKNKLEDCYRDAWDFKLFSMYPFFRIRDDVIMPVSMPLLLNTFTNGLYQKILACCRGKKERDKFQGFFGFVFEMFIQDFLEDACQKSRIDYKITRDSKGHKAPDFIIQVDKKLLVVEVKSQRMNFKEVMSSNFNVVEEDRYDMIVEPMNQLLESTMELYPKITTEVDEIYLIVVNQGEFPHLPLVIDHALRDWKELCKSKKIGPEIYPVHMDVEDVEILAEGLENDWVMFEVLRDKILNHPKVNLKRYMIDQRCPFEGPSFLHKGGKLLEKILERISQKP